MLGTKTVLHSSFYDLNKSGNIDMQFPIQQKLLSTSNTLHNYTEFQISYLFNAIGKLKHINYHRLKNERSLNLSKEVIISD
jgi:hypothetical protein